MNWTVAILAAVFFASLFVVMGYVAGYSHAGTELLTKSLTREDRLFRDNERITEALAQHLGVPLILSDIPEPTVHGSGWFDKKPIP